MATSQKGIQDLVHSLDQGGLVPIIRIAMFAALIITLTLLYLFVQFKGLSNSTAMDQAQIAREIAAGNGFSTKYIRPFAIWQLENAGKEVPNEKFPDFFQSPLPPFINSIPLKIVQSHWKLEPTDLVYIGDRMIAGTAILFFLLSVVVWYFIGLRLFDKKLALIGCAMILMTDLFWQFSLSGLPQMLMLLLFSGACLATLKAMEKKADLLPMLILLFAAGLLFGLMILCHGAAVWIFLGWFAFAVFYFHPRGISALVAMAAALLIVLPWLARNYSVSGNPLGIAGYELAVPAFTSESGFMRSISGAPSLGGMAPRELETLAPVGRRAEVLPRPPVRPELVVGRALLRVLEHFVGFLQLLEARLGVLLLADVRVVLAGQLAVGALDLVLRGGARHAHDLVVVLVAHGPTLAPAHGGRRPRFP